MRQRGSSLAELLVTLGLVSVVVLAASQLIAAATRVYHGARKAAPSPGETALKAMLRRDVQGASGAVEQPPSWNRRPLELVMWAGDRVRYSLDGEDLVREGVAVTGAVTSRRVIAGGIESWRWRLATPRTIEVRVTLLPRPGLGSAAGAVDRRSVRRVYSFRGLPDGRSW
jgi:hypothetical protein